MRVKFEFVPPPKLTLRERRQIRRGLQDKLIARAQAQIGKTVTGIVVDKGGACFARLQDGSRVRFGREEEQAWQQAVSWEQTGEGEVPKLPLKP